MGSCQRSLLKSILCPLPCSNQSSWWSLQKNSQIWETRFPMHKGMLTIPNKPVPIQMLVDPVPNNSFNQLSNHWCQAHQPVVPCLALAAFLNNGTTLSILQSSINSPVVNTIHISLQGHPQFSPTVVSHRDVFGQPWGFIHFNSINLISLPSPAVLHKGSCADL